MYILVERNMRGILEIKQTAFNKLLESTVSGSLTKTVEEVEVETEMYRENFLYVLVTLTLPKTMNTTEINERLIINQLESIVLQTLSLRPKNIAISYKRK